MPDPTLVDRLALHRQLGGVPHEQLEWLAARGEIRRFAPGDITAPKGDPIDHLFVVLTGHITITVDRGGAAHVVYEWRGGDVTGTLPFSRMRGAPGNAVAQEPTEVLIIHRDHFPAMVRACPDVIEVLVHEMLDRARVFNTDDLHSKRMESLGVLAAGLAHELNNPASAVVRSAAHLSQRFDEMDAALREYIDAGISREEHAAAVRLRSAAPAAGQTMSTPLERSDREDDLAAWLEEHDVDGSLAPALADSRLQIEALDTLADAMRAPKLGAVLRYVAADAGLRQIAVEIGAAATRMADLVSAVKRFSYVDHVAVRKPVDILRGLVDTVTLLGPKARQKSVDVRLEVPPDLPRIDGLGGELNQVWTNLIDNAISAAGDGGKVTVRTLRSGDYLVVEVEDDGPGIPDDVRERIFDAFFTTKPPGEGTGLGLDIANRIVARHHGDLRLKPGPGGACFQVLLPLPAG